MYSHQNTEMILLLSVAIGIYYYFFKIENEVRKTLVRNDNILHDYGRLVKTKDHIWVSNNVRIELSGVNTNC